LSIAESESGSFDVAVIFNEQHGIARSSLVNNTLSLAVYKYENEHKGNGIKPSLVTSHQLELDEMIALYKLD
jgi:hypothetical protein